MKTNKLLEISVGFLVLLGGAALFVLAFKVSGMGEAWNGKTYAVKAFFDNIGDLKVRAPVTMAGVKVGQVGSIHLDPARYQAEVTLELQQGLSLPSDSSASIYTAGLLGSNYIGLHPGFEEKRTLQAGSVIEETHPAIVLEEMIGQLVFSMTQKDKKE